MYESFYMHIMQILKYDRLLSTHQLIVFSTLSLSLFYDCVLTFWLRWTHGMAIGQCSNG